MTVCNNQKTPLLLSQGRPGVFTHSVFAANRQMPQIYRGLEEQRLAKAARYKGKQLARYKYQQTAKAFFGSSLRIDSEGREHLHHSGKQATLLPPFDRLPQGQRFHSRFYQPVKDWQSQKTANELPDIILSVSLLLTAPPVPLLTLTMPLNKEISASVTLPLNYYEEDANISAVFAVAYTINANLILAMAFPNDTYTHFTDPTVTLIFGLPINYMSGLSIPVSFGTEKALAPVLVINPLATPENPETGDVVVPPDMPAAAE